MIISGDVELNPGPGDVECKRSTRSKMLVSVSNDSKVNRVEQKKTKKAKKSVRFEVIYVLNLGKLEFMHWLINLIFESNGLFFIRIHL